MCEFRENWRGGEGLKQGCRLSVFSVIFGPIRSLPIRFPLFSIFSYFIFLFLSFLSLFVFIFLVRRHALVDFQLFSQKSSGIPVKTRGIFLKVLCLLAPFGHFFQLLLDSSDCCVGVSHGVVDKPVVCKCKHQV